MIEQPVVKKEIGLFEGMLGGETEVLFQDLVSCPHKYLPGTDILLQQMITGSKTTDNLTQDERMLLDQAAFEYAQPSRMPVEDPPPVQKKKEDPADYLPELSDEAEPKLKACPQCGCVNEQNATFCEACGGELKTQADDEPPSHGPMKAYWWL